MDMVDATGRLVGLHQSRRYNTEFLRLFFQFSNYLSQNWRVAIIFRTWLQVRSFQLKNPALHICKDFWNCSRVLFSSIALFEENVPTPAYKRQNIFENFILADTQSDGSFLNQVSPCIKINFQLVRLLFFYAEVEPNFENYTGKI